LTENRAHADEVIEWTPQSRRCQVSSFRGRFLWASEGAAGGMERRQRKEGCAVLARVCATDICSVEISARGLHWKSRKAELSVKS
jgi:hypothetical protein